MNITPTRFPELNMVLQDLTMSIKNILRENFVGAYLVGSFAVGDADINSDCDFLITLHHSLTTHQEANLRKLHNEIPTRKEFWAKHIEGSYLIQDDLRTLDTLGKKWLYIDHGHREMEWSIHCNTLEHRWSLRECGVVLVGPDPKKFTAEISPVIIKKQMCAAIKDFLPQLETWTSIDRIAWSQRYAVTTLCRMLYSIYTGQITSKRNGLVWAKSNVDQEWFDLIQQALDGRDLPWDDVPSSENVKATREFAKYAIKRALLLDGTLS